MNTLEECHIYLNSKQDMHMNKMYGDVLNTSFDTLYNYERNR
jgi:hypothetical protein